ncbi:monovalent cation/H(+) antiporter subunit G [Sphingomonas sp. CFBP 8760]|uniref:monovalent cation/H(+) antiporter subunit G n=1 Tax=Sphingomonas sp. CFBP 8760 TaxID=2775282 RepID=UPI001781D44C|nr:monovalent cation/H(+) antiporter subunit G [Sphingomonas sp. CFBP 8760]MBD8545766.1 monovalent cation/H(+) antiporter subunit G [Sphingomonas sp. CFBP 8760]
MTTLAGIVLMTLGVGFLLVAAIGLVRLPDALQRMHSATKAGTLGTALVILGAMLLGEVARPSTGLLTILFLLVTLPFGAQLLGRAAYLSGTPLTGIGDDPLGPEMDMEADRPEDVITSSPPAGRTDTGR